MAAADKARAVAHYAALAAEAEALAASRRANPAGMSPATLDECNALNAHNERVAKRAEAAVWLATALAIGGPFAWWLVEWAACGAARLGC